jgi:hypothetical protein
MTLRFDATNSNSSQYLQYLIYSYTQCVHSNVTTDTNKSDVAYLNGFPLGLLHANVGTVVLTLIVKLNEKIQLPQMLRHKILYFPLPCTLHHDGRDPCHTLVHREGKDTD